MAMKAVLLFAALCLLFVSATATVWTSYQLDESVNANYRADFLVPETLDDFVCSYVGVISGCSGCTLGTNGFCSTLLFGNLAPFWTLSLSVSVFD